MTTVATTSVAARDGEPRLPGGAPDALARSKSRVRLRFSNAARHASDRRRCHG